MMQLRFQNSSIKSKRLNPDSGVTSTKSRFSVRTSISPDPHPAEKWAASISRYSASSGVLLQSTRHGNGRSGSRSRLGTVITFETSPPSMRILTDGYVASELT